MRRHGSPPAPHSGPSAAGPGTFAIDAVAALDDLSAIDALADETPRFAAGISQLTLGRHRGGRRWAADGPGRGGRESGGHRLALRVEGPLVRRGFVGAREGPKWRSHNKMTKLF